MKLDDVESIRPVIKVRSNAKFLLGLIFNGALYKMLKNTVFHLFMIVLAAGCAGPAEEKKEVGIPQDVKLKEEHSPLLFSLLNPLQTGVKFINQLTETAEMNGFYYEYYYNGSGVSLSDINNDGLQDILFISTLRKNHLYLNQGGLKFKDITVASGLSGSTGFRTGVTNVDINSDGRMDYYISRSGKYSDPSKRENELWVNQGVNNKGIPVFKEEAAKYNLDIAMCSTQAAFFDYDLDGDLDMFLINHYPVLLNYEKADQFMDKEGVLTGDRLYENRNGKYYDVTGKAGLSNTNRLSYGLGISVGDMNNDGYPDVYVSNDYEGKDFLYQNNGNGTFRDVANEATRHTSLYSMGTDISDINNDGWLDLMSLDMMSEDNYGIKTGMSAMNPEKFNDVVEKGLHYQYMYNALQVNNGAVGARQVPSFSDIAQFSGVSSTDWSWGPLFFDMDNDGYTDLFVSNGIKRNFRNNDFALKRKNAIKMPLEDDNTFIQRMLNEMPVKKKENYFFKNNGDLSFSKKNGKWLFDIPSSSNGAAFGDLDNDGDLDLVVNNSDDVSLIYQNHATELSLGNYLVIKLLGPSKNPHGIGARVALYDENNIQVQEHYLTRGFQSTVSPGLHFGLGMRSTIEQLTVTWPDGRRQVLDHLAVNQVITLNYQDASPGIGTVNNTEAPVFSPVDNQQTGILRQHRENPFNDFERESLLPHKMSQFGPALATGDFNGDQLEDLYIGGAHNQAPVLYQQLPDGTFQSVQEAFFTSQKDHEDVDAFFFDADNDGDLDLYVVSGGNEKPLSSGYYQDRLYENQNSIFRDRSEALPSFLTSGACVRPYDYDQDGDLDLFVGGRQYPGRYPAPVNSYLLRNDSQKKQLQFTDVTEDQLPELYEIGMVTDALWADLKGDGYQDLVIVGEWITVHIFDNTGEQLTNSTASAGLQDQVGWWNAVEAADIDRDGDLDIIAGNLGLNYKYKATPSEPFKIYGNDFDGNGTFDIVLGFHEGEKVFPLRGRECSSQQMPFIKKKFPDYDAFGKALLADIYSEELLKHSIAYSATTFATTFFENEGNGAFKAQILPNEAQLTSVNDIIVEDFDHDGHLDLVLAGNLYGSEVETPRNDAGIGIYLRGNGKGNFSPVPMYESGLYVPGEVRHIKKLKLSHGSNVLIFARNNAMPGIVKWNGL